MFLFYVLSFFKKEGHYSRGDIIQGRTLFKEIRYVKMNSAVIIPKGQIEKLELSAFYL